MEKILVLIKNTGDKTFHAKQIENSLPEFQKIVGGYIETVNIESDIVFVCNEEGKLKNLKPNFKMDKDIVVGNVIFTKANENGDFIDLTIKDIFVVEKFINTFCKLI